MTFINKTNRNLTILGKKVIPNEKFFFEENQIDAIFVRSQIGTSCIDSYNGIREITNNGSLASEESELIDYVGNRIIVITEKWF